MEPRLESLAAAFTISAVTTAMLRRTLAHPLQNSRFACRSLFVNTETTPNPHSLKFRPDGKEVLPERFGTGMFFQLNDKNNMNSDKAHSPLAKQLFEIKGVKGVFLGRDFITITKSGEEQWQIMKPQLFSKILDFYALGKDAVEEKGHGVSDTAILDTDDEVVATIKELIETRVRPSVQEDGGDIFYKGFDKSTGIVKLQMAGSCVGCPSSSVTLRNGVESMLMHYIPEVKGIENIEPESELSESDDLLHAPKDHDKASI